jgi:ABC-type dipeptide/oligopeptide/nickel transport system permease component
LLTYILRRFLYSIPVLVAASFLIFAFTVTTADPLSELKQVRNVNQNAIALITKEKHLDKPVIVRYGYWVRDAVTNKFGTTIFGDRPIWDDLKRVIPNTLQLLLAAEIFSVLFAIIIGVYSAIRQYSVFDYLATSFSFLGLAVPVFWLALILQVVVTNIFLKWDIRIFYTAQLSSVDPGHGFHFFVDRVQHLVLPVTTLVVVNVAGYSRYMRASMLEVINSDYVRTARAKGLTERRTIMKHAFRNALIPLTTLVALDLGLLFGGAIITETIFALDGMGLYFIHALDDGDPYPLMAWLMITAVMIVIGNLVADIVYGFLDPRIRYE